ncbi:response regulator, partial [bacterium]|nr:response regulator [bacterium]
LLLTDFHMPRMDGFELTAAARKLEAADPAGTRLPIVALTADALPGTRERCLEADMDDYLSKPIEIEKLLAMIERLAPTAMALRIPAAQSDGDGGKKAKTARADDLPARLAAIDREIFDPARLDEAFGGVDGEALEFIAGFLDRARELIDETLAAFAAENPAAARHAVHALKGSALAVGAERLGRIAGDVQDLIDAGDIDTAPMFAEALVPTLDELIAGLAPVLPHRSAGEI